MTMRAKIDLDAAPSGAEVMGVMAQWRWNHHSPRAAVPEKASWGAPPSTPKFGGTYYGRKGCSLVFNYAESCEDWFTHVRREIVDYVNKEYMDGGDICWKLEQ